MYCSGVASTCRQPAKTASYFPINKYGTEWSELVGSHESNTFTLDSTHIHLISDRSNFTTPQFYNSFTRGHFTTSHLPGSEVSAPKFSLCLPVPFTRLPFHLVCVKNLCRLSPIPFLPERKLHEPVSLPSSPPSSSTPSPPFIQTRTYLRTRTCSPS